jgi:hypothetical protein|tara:strand:+ start:198 stop:362 length:165 start_codon:yes stop_codon:yes gene_type:complete
MTKIKIGGNLIVECMYKMFKRGDITKEQYEKAEENLRKMSKKERTTEVIKDGKV